MERAELTALVRATGCAEERGGFVYLCDPKWRAAERAQVDALQARVRGAGAGAGAARMDTGWLGVPTGGTSGGVRFARHDERTLSAAAAGFCAHFGLGKVNAVDVLPPHHVSGLMARVRSAATGGRHVPWAWKRLEAGECPEIADTPDGWVISLVPTQLARLLESGRTSGAALDWLRRFRIIFIGGGPAWPALLDEAARRGLPIALSYGMTETAAMVVALRPAEFAAGARDCGRVMPHARVEIVSEAGEGGGSGATPAPGETGLVRIGGASLFGGYVPDTRTEAWLETEDVGFLDARGALTILGRRDAVIITGGKKVYPSEVEAALRTSGEFADVAVIGLPDAEWGQVVVGCHPAGERAVDPGRVKESLAALAAFKHPKRFVALAEWPRNAQGKVNRAALIERARQAPEAREGF